VTGEEEGVVGEEEIVAGSVNSTALFNRACLLLADII